MHYFMAELQQCFKLMLHYHQTLGIAVLATLLMIVVQSPTLQLIEQAHYESLVFYGLVPIALLALLYRVPFSQLQLGFGDIKFWLPASTLYLLVAVPVVVLGAQATAINGYYQKQTVDWANYIFTTGVYMLGWEYFYRGFLLAGLRKHLKEGAIIVQMIPFTLLHLGKPDAETITCIFSGLVWGYICYRAKTFWPAFIMHLIVNITAVAAVNGGLVF
ncbi:MAG: CPBP family intramembrane glutamic endopeptidase [Marinagarivorans sp.]|nr:CPBP family intramembrane glutamic endopeptidase [Marinagarivorans sp.]